MESKALRRIERLVDRGSFRPFRPGIETAHIQGEALVNGRPVHVCSTNTDPVTASPLASIHAQVDFLEHVLREPAPLVHLIDTPGHASQAEGGTPIPPDADRLLAGARGVGRPYCLQSRLSGMAPQIAVLFGRIGAALSFPLALADIRIMVRGSAVCAGRPDAVRFMTGEETDFEKLGGAEMHCRVSGLGDVLAPDEENALSGASRCLGYLPVRAGAPVPVLEAEPPSESVLRAVADMPGDPNKPFAMKRLVHALADGDSFLEIKPLYAPECIAGLARINGRAAGILANDSTRRGGILFPETCRKMTRLVSLCDAFGIPMIFLADTPGFMVGEAAEQGGIVEAGAELMKAVSRSRIPKMCVAVRKAYTAGLYAMAGPGFDPACFLASPAASISVFGPKALERFAGNRELCREGRRTVEEMLEQSRHPDLLTAKGLVDEVVPWSELRDRTAAFLEKAPNRLPDS